MYFSGAMVLLLSSYLNQDLDIMAATLYPVSNANSSSC